MKLKAHLIGIVLTVTAPVAIASFDIVGWGPGCTAYYGSDPENQCFYMWDYIPRAPIRCEGQGGVYTNSGLCFWKAYREVSFYTICLFDSQTGEYGCYDTANTPPDYIWVLKTGSCTTQPTDDAETNWSFPAICDHGCTQDYSDILVVKGAISTSCP